MEVVSSLGRMLKMVGSLMDQRRYSGKGYSLGGHFLNYPEPMDAIIGEMLPDKPLTPHGSICPYLAFFKEDLR